MDGKGVSGGPGSGKAGGGSGSTNKGSGGGGSSGGPMMKAPGGDGANISREAFESNPKAYFSDLHAAQKTKDNK